MKTTLLLAAGLLLTACTTTKVKLPDEGAVSQEILAGFLDLHPKSTNQVWELRPDGQYSVRYRILGFRYRDILDPTGQLVLTQRSVYEYSLPTIVRTLLYDNYDDHKIQELSGLVFPDGQEVYDVELNGSDGEPFVLRFSKEGELMTRTPSAEYKWFL